MDIFNLFWIFILFFSLLYRMDKIWISNNTLSKEKYIRGVLNFHDFAFEKSSKDGKILCPCTKCFNFKWRSRVDVYDHIINHGFLKGYTNWIFHGEQIGSSNSLSTSQVEAKFDYDMDTLIHDAFAMHSINESDDMHINMEDGDPEAFINEHNVRQPLEGNNPDNRLYQLLKEAEQNLYPGCKKFTKLSFIVHLYHLKCLNGWTDKSFSMLLELLNDALPEENTLPRSFYDTKKIISGLGLAYEKIHVCPNDCILYWRDLANSKICPKCGLSRWKLNSNDGEGRKKVPAKILRWFPLKPRLQRLFLSSKTASSMTWHEDGRTKDGLMRHPADSVAWKDFDLKYPNFSCDPRNVRLGLASDGFNPFKTMTIAHSTWPVILVPYNLPPWMCMKQPKLSLLIPGPKGLGNKLDVYMQPLVEELKELWEIGRKTFDAYKNESFQMAVIIWTINDSLRMQICLVGVLKVDMLVHVVVLKLPLSGCIIVKSFAICVIVVG